MLYFKRETFFDKREKRMNTLLEEREGQKEEKGGSYVSPVALLIDGENVPADFAVDYLAYAGKLGGVTIKRVFGNWSAPQLHVWKEAAIHYGFSQVQQSLPVFGKNATDIALVVEAIEIYHGGIRHFCLVGGDSDYTPAIRWLIEHGCLVAMIGKGNTSLVVQKACTFYIAIDKLLPNYRYKRQLFQGEIPSKIETSGDISLEELFTRSYKQADVSGRNDWVPLVTLGKYIKQTEPHFEAKDYGFPTMKALVRKKFPFFQIREIENGQASIRLWDLGERNAFK